MIDHASRTTPTIYLSIFLGLAGISAQGDAAFLLSNRDMGVRAPVFDSKGEPLGPDYRVALYVGPTSEDLAITLEYRENKPAIGKFRADLPGYFTIEYRNFPEVVLARNVSEGQIASLLVRAWDSRLGETFEQVLDLGIGGYGESDLFQVKVEPPSARQIHPLTGLESFSLLPVVPESPQFGRVRVLPDRQVEASVVGPLDQNFALQFSANLIDWETLTHSTFTDTPMIFVDAEVTNFASRFYRILMED
jgi:hypothetical protein